LAASLARLTVEPLRNAARLAPVINPRRAARWRKTRRYPPLPKLGQQEQITHKNSTTEATNRISSFLVIHCEYGAASAVVLGPCLFDFRQGGRRLERRERPAAAILARRRPRTSLPGVGKDVCLTDPSDIASYARNPSASASFESTAERMKQKCLLSK
jgi:hypothetical protein